MSKFIARYAHLILTVSVLIGLYIVSQIFHLQSQLRDADYATYTEIVANQLGYVLWLAACVVVGGTAMAFQKWED